MEKLERKKAAVLGAVIAALALYWGYAAFFGGEAEKAAPGGRAARGKAVKLTPPQAVDVGLLDMHRPEVSITRNVFSPVYRPPEVKPPTKGQAQTVTVTPGPPPPPPPPPKTREELEAEKAQKEMEKFKFVGFIKKKGRTDVFLTLGDEYFMAPKGGLITKEYYLKDVGADYLLFEDRATGVEVKLDVDFEEGSASKTVASPGASGGPSTPPSRPGPPVPQGTQGRGGRSYGADPRRQAPGAYRQPPPGGGTVVTPPVTQPTTPTTGGTAPEDFIPPPPPPEPTGPPEPPDIPMDGWSL